MIQQAIKLYLIATEIRSFV